MTSHINLTFDDVLTSLLEEAVTPTHAELLVWTRRYPQFAEELAHYFAEWSVEIELADEDVARSREEHFENVGVSHALNLLHARRAGTSSVQKPASTIAILCRAAGLTFALLAEKAGLDEELVMKLDRGRIAVSGIPRRLATTLATLLEVRIEDIWRALSLPPRATSRGALQKSRGPAQILTETFEQAINASTLPSDKRAAWLLSVHEGTGPP